MKDFQTGFTAVKFEFLRALFPLKIPVVWNVKRRRMRQSCRRFEYTVILQNDGKYSPTNTALRSRRHESSKIHIPLEHDKLIYG